jgi:hypothetical protein
MKLNMKHEVSIGIDVSTTSTAVTIITNWGDIKHHVFTNKLTKYHKDSKCIKSHLVSNIEDTLRDQVNKLIDDNSTDYYCKYDRYDRIAKDVAFEVNKYFDCKYHIYFEGYSYSSQAGCLIDLVTLTTLIKKEINNNRMQYNNLYSIVAPASLKKFACGNAHKKDKHDMMNNLIEKYPEFELVKELKELKIGKAVPKPFEDVVDSMWLALLDVSSTPKEDKKENVIIVS